MKVKGVRLYGVKDIRLEEFEIPEIAEDEILLKIECNGIAVSTLKEITLAQRHLRVPKNIKKNPVLIGHEFSGTIAKVGTRWKEDYQEGKQFVLVPEIPHQIESPGYSYPYFGGAATWVIQATFFLHGRSSAGVIMRSSRRRGCTIRPGWAASAP